VEERRILLAVTGGIAAYKTPELVRALRRAGHTVRCAMTRAAAEFVSPLALLVSGRLLAPGATVVVERSRRHPLPSVAGLVSQGSRRYGDTELEWLEAGDPPADEGER